MRSRAAEREAREAYARDAALAIDQGERDAELAVERAERDIASQRAFFASRGFRAGAGGSSSGALARRTLSLGMEDARNIVSVAENRAASIRQAGSSAVNRAQSQTLSSLGDAGAYLARGVQYAADKWG